MNPWATIWAWIITASLLLFAAVAIAVAIGGFFNVRAMFRKIVEQHEPAQPTRRHE